MSLGSARSRLQDVYVTTACPDAPARATVAIDRKEALPGPLADPLHFVRNHTDAGLSVFLLRMPQCE